MEFEKLTHRTANPNKWAIKLSTEELDEIQVSSCSGANLMGIEAGIGITKAGAKFDAVVAYDNAESESFREHSTVDARFAFFNGVETGRLVMQLVQHFGADPVRKALELVEQGKGAKV